MSGEMIFDHIDDRPIGPQTPMYQSILDDIKKATAHLLPPDSNSPFLEGVELEYYELSLDLGDGHYILFPKNPDTHKVLSWMHARRMPDSSKSLLHPFLEKLSETFACFSLYYGDGYDRYNIEDEIGDRSQYSDYSDNDRSEYSDSGWIPDYTACSSDDCGYCGRCDY